MEAMNAIGAVTHPDPYPWYAAQAARGLHYDAGLRLWIAPTPALIREVMTHPACRVRPVAEPVPMAIAGSAGELFAMLVRMNDGPRHEQGRAALQPVLASFDAGRAVMLAKSIAESLYGPGAEALNDVVAETPVRTIAALLGFESAQQPDIAALVAQFVACLSPLSTVAQIAKSHSAARALMDAMRALHDLPLPLLANMAGLMSQTYEATAGLIGNSYIALWRRRGEQQGDVDADTVVTQTARNDPSIQNTRRYLAEDALIGGQALKAGDGILLLLAAGAQDGLGFGHGAHACPGQQLAHAIAKAVLQALGRQPLPGKLAWRYRPSVNARIPEFLEAV